MLIKALSVLLMFGIFIFVFSYFSEKDGLGELEITNEFKIKENSGWKLRLVEKNIFELTRNGKETFNKIEFFILDSLKILDSTSIKTLAEKIIKKEIIAYKQSKLNFSNSYLEHLKNHKFYSLEEVKIIEKDWYIYTLHNSDKQTSVWVNVFTILGNDVFAFRIFYSAENLSEIVGKNELASLLKNFLAQTKDFKKEPFSF